MSPAPAEHLFFQGVALMAGDAAAAEACFRQALALAPDLMEAHANLGLLLDARGARDEAAACYRRAIALGPDQLEPYLNLGGLLTTSKQFAQAQAVYLQALQLAPDAPGLWSNVGVLYAALKREAQAEQCYRHALALDPTHSKARFNLAYVLLRQGRYEEGWHCMEARDWYAALAARLACPRWQGEPLQGQSVLIGFEAGHGDMIQMLRYAAVLKARGARHVAVLCHPALKRLFCAQAGVDQVLGLDQPWPAAGWDVWTPPFSLPYHCQTRLDTIPAALPYLQAQPDLVAAWAQKLPRRGTQAWRVGLAWRGNPKFENDADRSLPGLAVLSALASVPGVCWVSLQKGVGEDQALAPPAGMALRPLGAGAQDFADLAALIMALDLVISVDTAVAHLAGALGKPVWVLLPHHMTDWRWLADRTDSPWYPGVMRLFRQTRDADWAPVVHEVWQALQQFCCAPPAPAGPVF